MTSVPGHVGWPLIGDRAYEFYKDPVAFWTRNLEHYESSVFQSRFLNKTTVIVGSHNGVKQVIAEETGSSMEMGYDTFMEQIYGSNILFSCGIPALDLHHVLGSILTPDQVHNYRRVIDKIIQQTLMRFNDREPLCIYSFFKKLTTEICLSLFLDMDFEAADSEADDIIALTTTHWHGIISLPVFINALGSKNSYCKALEAKEKLLEIIDTKLSDKHHDGFVQQIKAVSSPSPQFASNHILLFTSSLVPKALSSLLTSFFIVTSNMDQVRLATTPDLVDCVLLEVQRMYPPFFGGRRIVKKGCVIDGYHVPAGNAVLFLIYSAHRDPKAFTNPEEFCPERWKNIGDDKNKKLFTFGGGPRCCVGENLVQSIIKAILNEVIQNYTWEVVDGQNLEYKWLPVSRPKENVQVQFRPRKVIKETHL